MSNENTTVSQLGHVALIARDLSRTHDFYERLLGLRALGKAELPLATKTGVRNDVAAWFGGSSSGTPLLAIVESPDAQQGAPGIGGSHHFALAVADREVLLRWKRRFLDNGYKVNGILDRHYFQSIYVKDPDGQIVELATRGPGWTIDEPADAIGTSHMPPPAEMINTNRDRARIAAENWPDPVEQITDAMRIDGLHHVTAIGTGIRRTHNFFSDTLGMRLVKQTSNFDDAGSLHWYWGVGSGAPGTLVTYFERKPERERLVQPGAGQIAHYGMTANDAEAVHELLSRQGVSVSPLVTVNAPDGNYTAFATADPDGHPVIIGTPR